jgi:Protein of unknown function (DUF2281)
MTTNEPTLEDKIHALPHDLRREVEDFVEFLLHKRRRAALDDVATANGWPDGFIAATAGSIDDPSFVRHPQGEADERLPLE